MSKNYLNLNLHETKSDFDLHESKSELPYKLQLFKGV